MFIPSISPDSGLGGKKRIMSHLGTKLKFVFWHQGRGCDGGAQSFKTLVKLNKIHLQILIKNKK